MGHIDNGSWGTDGVGGGRGVLTFIQPGATLRLPFLKKANQALAVLTHTSRGLWLLLRAPGCVRLDELQSGGYTTAAMAAQQQRQEQQ